MSELRDEVAMPAETARANAAPKWLAVARSSEARIGTRRQLGSVRVMENERRTVNVRDIWRLVLAVIGVVAVVQELRKPEEERTWHGTVAGFVPYDFRMPTVDRLRSTYWNPDGPIFSSKVFGVGWAPNFGALASMVGTKKAGEESTGEESDSSED